MLPTRPPLPRFSAGVTTARNQRRGPAPPRTPAAQWRASGAGRPPARRAQGPARPKLMTDHRDGQYRSGPPAVKVAARPSEGVGGVIEALRRSRDVTPPGDVQPVLAGVDAGPDVPVGPDRG